MASKMLPKRTTTMQEIKDALQKELDVQKDTYKGLSGRDFKPFLGCNLTEVEQRTAYRYGKAEAFEIVLNTLNLL